MKYNPFINTCSCFIIHNIYFVLRNEINLRLFFFNPRYFDSKFFLISLILREIHQSRRYTGYEDSRKGGSQRPVRLVSMILNERKTRNCPRERDPIGPKVGRGSCSTMPPAVFFSLMFVRMNDSRDRSTFRSFFLWIISCIQYRIKFHEYICAKIIWTYII